MDEFIKREIWESLVKDFEKKEVAILLGPRQTGKTTLLMQLIKHLENKGCPKKNIFYFNFDDVDIRSKIKLNFYFIKKEIELTLGKLIEEVDEQIYIFIDEGQKVPEIFDLVKIFYEKKYHIKVFISGSSSINIKDKSTETLAGRVHYFYLSPLVFSEATGTKLSVYNDLEDITFSSIVKQKASDGYPNRKKYEYFLQKMMIYGSLPKIISYPQEEILIFLNNFISTYLDKDIKDIGAKVNIENFHLSFKYLTDYISDLFNFSKLASDLGIKRDSIYRYFELLEKTLVIQTLPPFISPSVKHIFKSRKLFFFDGGIANRLKGILDFEELKRSQYLGRIFENLIFQNFYIRGMNDIKKPSFYYFRDYQNHEIDFIYHRGEIIIPIETTYTDTISTAKIRNFRKFFSLHNP